MALRIDQDSAAVADPVSDPSEPEVAAPPIKRISRATANFLLDGTMLVVFLLHLWVSVAVEFVFPAEGGASGASLWGGSYAAWTQLRLYSLCGLAVLILVHLVLHWNWVCGYVATRISRLAGRRIALDESSRTLYGVGTLILVLSIAGLLLLAAEFAVKTP